MTSIQNQGQQDITQQVETIDFKMVTFRLGGKDYGIDIMKVKEISEVGSFTYVPNTAPYVKGVFNLRGEIVSVIDLRTMFNLTAPDGLDSDVNDIIFLRLEDKVIGVIVDDINNVVGVSSEHIQPPHPLFGDINIQHISGVVERDGNLYIILDAEAMFGVSAKAEEPEMTMVAEQRPVSEIAPVPREGPLDFNFVAETLETFRSFYVSSVNEEWVKGRFEEWKQSRGSDITSVQLKDPSDAD